MRRRVEVMLDGLVTVAILFACAVIVWPRLFPDPAMHRTPSALVLPKKPLSLSGVSTIGERSAPVGVVEFSDFQCPFCSRHSNSVLPVLRREYVDSGKVLYAFRHFPITNIHPLATKAAEAAECAGAQGRFWEMHHALFQSPKRLAVEELVKHTAAIGVDATAFEACLSGSMSEKVQADAELARRIGFRGTPNFLVGTLSSDGFFVAREVIRGAQPVETFRRIIDSLLLSPAR